MGMLIVSPPHAVRLSVRIYRVLLLAYPAAFREEYSDVMQATFRDALQVAHARAGVAGLTGLWLRIVKDLVSSATRERLDALRQRTHQDGMVDAMPAPKKRRPIMGTLLHDTRYALHSLLRAPTFTAICLLTLGIGIAAVVTIFGVIEGVLLRPLPYPEADRIVRIYGAHTDGSEDRANVSPIDAMDWREQSRTLEDIALTNGSFFALTGVGEPAMVWVTAASAALFDALEVRPVLGRGFTVEDETIGQHRVVMLSHSFWQSRFGGDPSVVGRTVSLQGNAYEIIGVLPGSFMDPSPGPFGDAAMWRPFAFEYAPEARGGHWLQAWARLSPGATLAGAQQELRDIMARLAKEYPATNTGQTVKLRTLHDAFAGELRRPLAVLFGSVAFLLLIACANVANLMLARATTRRRELAIRAALGAGRLRIARQLFGESLLIAFGAAAIGVGMAWGGLRLAASFVGQGLGVPGDIRIDGTVVLFAIAMSALTAILFGLAPALQAMHGDLQGTLRDAGRGSTTGVAGSRMRGTLVVFEVAITLVLLVGAGLLARSFQRLNAVDAGFDRRSALTATLSLPATRYPATQEIAFFQEFERRARALPAVREAGLVNMLPMSNRWSCDSFAVGDREPPPHGQEPCAETRTVSPTYFDAFGIPALRGRSFTDADREGAPLVAMVNSRLVNEFWPGQDPVGKRVKWGWFGADTPWLEIVGVVGDVKHFGLDGEDRATIYMPMAQRPSSQMTLVVGTRTDPASVASDIRAIVRSLDPDLPLTRLETMAQVVSRSVAEPRFRTLLLAVFAGIGLLLSLTGLYSVLAFAVAQRTHEFGIRMAIGAGRGDVSRMVVRQGLRFAFGGVIVGLPLALLSTRALRGLLFEIAPTDAATFGAITALIVSVATLASWVPAHRSTRVDPMIALREE
jgi:putative ABC transport system permease protein